EQINVGNKAFYTGFLIVSTVLGCTAPFIILLFKKPSWKVK
ncbi:MAG: hypothetical protein K1000chlam3_00391, partial [Chlamydiae bacterium]|nr:hypothetical protein [Chlamydiota bacterium]